MKMVKSILGSAAGLLAIGGAQAADLPVKAKAVEYVKVCSLYGAGFYYIPGTDTCIKLGGYLRVETWLGTNSVVAGTLNGVGGAHNRLGNYYTSRARQDVNLDTRTATEYGVLRTFFNGNFTWTTGGVAGSGATPGSTAYTGDNIAGGSLGVYFAFIQFAGFTLGKSISIFDAPWTGYPGGNHFELFGQANSVTGVNNIQYTAELGQGVSAAISVQDPTAYYQSNIFNVSGATAAGIATGAYGTNNFGGTRSPDILGRVRVDQAWGLFQLSAALHNNHVGYYGASEATGHPDDKWGWAVQAALSIKNIPTGPGDVINVQAVYTDGASRYNFQNLLPTTFAMYGGSGLPGAYQSLAFAGVADAVYGGTTSATGTQLSAVKTWGFNGAYTHNWDPYWNTAIYGSYARANYSGEGKALVCSSPALIGPAPGGLALTGTCNPDFSIGMVGLITRWTPVKNLTFSVDTNWTRLDQNHSGTVTAPTVAAVAKPGAVYELKDQNSVAAVIRAQRVF